MSNQDQLRAYAERLAAVAQHTFSSDETQPAQVSIDDFVGALDRHMRAGLTLEEAYKLVFARLADGVADG